MRQIVKVSIAGKPVPAVPAPAPLGAPAPLPGSASVPLPVPVDTAPDELPATALPPDLPDQTPAALPRPAPGPNPLLQARTALLACAGSVELTVGELQALQQGQVLKLERILHEPVELFLEGEVVGRGDLIAVDDRFAVRLLSLDALAFVEPMS